MTVFPEALSVGSAFEHRAAGGQVNQNIAPPKAQRARTRGESKDFARMFSICLVETIEQGAAGGESRAIHANSE
jgi:hypothetical protein